MRSNTLNGAKQGQTEPNKAKQDQQRIFFFRAHHLWGTLCPGHIFSGAQCLPGRIVLRGKLSPGHIVSRGTLSPGAYCLLGHIVSRGTLSPGHTVSGADCLGAHCLGANCLGAHCLGAPCPPTFGSHQQIKISLSQRKDEKNM